ncbi:MAG TPA: HlyD family efflux transporter periplasmic adaptor subunit [Gemmatimonadales bacterium]|nr:HlyD family efflux transporter periplasmic adaptor subunit [Gemmatimonadales bacterium]
MVIVALAVAAWLVTLYREHRREISLGAARDEPVVAPSRLVEDKGAVVVALDTAEVRRLGLRVVPLELVAGEPKERLIGEVVPELERTAVLRAPVAGRLTLPPGSRWPGLGERVAAGAAVGQVSDARPLSMPIAGVVTSVGAQPGALVTAGQSLLEIADYSRPVVRVVWLERMSPTPARRVAVGPSDTGSRVDARLIGPAPEADLTTRRPAYLYRAAHSWPGAAPGVPVVVYVPGSARPRGDALVIPDAAVVQWEGLTWAYRRRGPGRFERLRVATAEHTTGGWVAGPPFTRTDSVVVRGAEELLSEEFRARVTVGDESGE